VVSVGVGREWRHTTHSDLTMPTKDFFAALGALIDKKSPLVCLYDLAHIAKSVRNAVSLQLGIDDINPHPPLPITDFKWGSIEMSSGLLLVRVPCWC